MNDVDSQLVAYLHGELDSRTARAARRRLAEDPALRAQLAALRSADAALLSLLEPPTQARSVRPIGWRPLLAASALVVTAWLALRAQGETAAAHNDVVGLTVMPAQGALHPVLTDIALEFRWQNRLPAKPPRRLDVLPYHLGDTLEAIGRRAAEAPDRDAKVPLVVSAIVHTPTGERLTARLAGPSISIGQTPHLQTEALRSFELASDAPPPHLGGRPGTDRWLEDFAWAAANMPDNGPRRLLLDEPGEWTLELKVHSVPPPTPGSWPVFDAPLHVVTKIRATGLVSDWGPTVDGLQARLVLATGCIDLDRAPLALQLRCVSDRARHYQLVGRNDAPIPQPFHLRLYHRPPGVDGQAQPLGEQRTDLGIEIPTQPKEVRQAPGTVRSLVVCAAYWRPATGPSVLDGLPGKTRVFAEFHFLPSAWHDLDLWQGQLTTGSVELPAVRRK